MINILFADEHIPGSPFKARISYPFDASKVKVEGPGIEPGIRAGEPADIDIDTRMAGDAELKVEVVDDLNSPVKCDVEEEEYGIYAVTYYPEKKGNVIIIVKNFENWISPIETRGISLSFLLFVCLHFKRFVYIQNLKQSYRSWPVTIDVSNASEPIRAQTKYMSLLLRARNHATE